MALTPEQSEFTLPRMNEVAVLSDVFTAHEVGGLHSDLEDRKIWDVLPGRFGLTEPAIKVIDALQDRKYLATALVIGRLSALAAQSGKELPLLSCRRVVVANSAEHQDAEAPQFVRFVVVEAGVVTYILNRNGVRIPAAPGSVLATNNLSPFTDTRAWHEAIEGTGKRFLASFIAQPRY